MTTVPDRQIVTETVATLLTTLAECPDGTREGIAYAGLSMASGIDLDTFYYVVAFLAEHGYVKRGRSHKLDITDQGKVLAAKIEAAIAKGAK